MIDLRKIVVPTGAVLGLVLILAPEATVLAQSSAAQTAPAFDVASIRPHRETADTHNHIYNDPHNGEFRAVNISVKALIRMAFVLPETRIVGGPKWLAAEPFDIDAKADDTLNEQLRALDSDHARVVKQRMVQALLADRFHLKVHEEKRELALYALVVAKGGAKLEKNDADGTSVSTGRGRIAVQGSDRTVTLLAEQLASLLGRVVVDTTGITGRYTIKLTWTPEDASPSKSADGSAADTFGPTLFTAIQEQLGLKLEPRKGPVDVLVVDSVEEPTAN